MAKKFKPGEVKELKKNQYVLDVAPDRLVLTLPFRQGALRYGIQPNGGCVGTTDKHREVKHV